MISRPVRLPTPTIKNVSNERLVILNNDLENLEIIEVGATAKMPIKAQGEFLIIKRNKVLVFKPFYGNTKLTFQNETLLTPTKEVIEPIKVTEFKGYWNIKQN